MKDFKLVGLPLVPEYWRDDLILAILDNFLEQLPIEFDTEAELYSALEWEALAYAKENLDRIQRDEPNPVFLKQNYKEQIENWAKKNNVKPVAETTTDN